MKFSRQPLMASKPVAIAASAEKAAPTIFTYVHGMRSTTGIIAVKMSAAP
jgi:hypothetical protein